MRKYLKGDMSGLREESSFSPVVNTDDVAKEDLIKSRDNKEFQVINLVTMEYFSPEDNSWVAINQE